MNTEVAQKKVQEAREHWYKDWLLVPIALAVVGVDQLSKYLIRASLDPYEAFPQEGIVRIYHIHNTGGAFGFFPNQTLFLIVASVIAIGVLLFVYRRHPFPGVLLRLSLGLMLGGAIGNLVDRLRLGYVTDFVQLGWWPVFNVADASINMGITVLVILILWPVIAPRIRPASRPPSETALQSYPVEKGPAHTSDEPSGMDR